MQIVFSFLYFSLFIFVIYKVKFFEIAGFPKHILVAYFTLKVLAGITVWWVYTCYYAGGDMQNYFSDGHHLFHLLMDKPRLFYEVVFRDRPYNGLKIWNSNYDYTLYNDARSLSLLNMVFLFFSFGYFQVHIIFMCFLSLIGLTALYHTFEKYLVRKHIQLFVVIFLIPSVLFWSSGVLKEGILFFGLGIFLYASNCGMPTTYSFKKIIVILLSISILLLIKFYVLVALLPGLYLNFIVSRTSDRYLLLKYSSSIFIIIFGAIVLTYLNNDYNPLKLVKDKQVKAILEARGGVYLANRDKVICINYANREKQLIVLTDSTYKIQRGSNYIFWKANDMSVYDSVRSSLDTTSYKIAYSIVPANSIMHIDFLKSDFSNIFIVLPQALFNVFFQPTIWSVDDAIQLFPAIENLIIIVLIILSIIFFNKRHEHKEIVFFCLSFVFILFVLVGITTPAVGAIVRYKIPALPFLIIAMLLITKKKKVH